MQAFVGWFVVLAASVAAVLASVELTMIRARQGARPYRAGVLTILASAAALVVLALVWRIRRVADLDASVISLLAAKRNSVVTEVMTVVTTIGDPIPSFTIAAVLAVIVYLRGRHRVLPVLIPLAVVVELAAQILITNVFHDVTVAQLHPGLPLGGGGTIPSGSVARLFSIFLIAALLLGARSARAHGLVALGSALVTIQLVSRLYLGRHLLADILGGLLLGIILARLAYFAIGRSAPSTTEADPVEADSVEESPLEANSPKSTSLSAGR